MTVLATTAASLYFWQI